MGISHLHVLVGYSLEEIQIAVEWVPQDECVLLKKASEIVYIKFCMDIEQCGWSIILEGVFPLVHSGGDCL